MRTIAVIGRKGGSGKTTVTINLGIAAHRRRLKTLLADCDPQRSMSDVLKSRRDSDPPVVETTRARLFALQASSLRDGTDVLFIDTAAGEENDLAHAIVLADLALLVVRPTLLDFAALVRTLKVIRHLRKRAMVVLNQAPARRSGVEPAAVRNALEVLQFLRLPVSPAILRTRVAYQAALQRGCSVEEHGGDAAAAAEVSQLWSSVEAAGAARETEPAEPIGEFIVNDVALF